MAKTQFLACLSLLSWVMYFASILQHGYLSSKRLPDHCNMGIFTADPACKSGLKALLMTAWVPGSLCYSDSIVVHFDVLQVFACLAMLPLTVAMVASVSEMKQKEQEHRRVTLWAHVCGALFAGVTWILMATLYTRKVTCYFNIPKNNDVSFVRLSDGFDLYWSFGCIVAASALQATIALMSMRSFPRCCSSSFDCCSCNCCGARQTIAGEAGQKPVYGTVPEAVAPPQYILYPQKPQQEGAVGHCPAKEF
eukprot:TRINITY_DN4887_c0_g1_i1.p1 TRINITY_DN4887_c0_g1~~TRINITY_DN4887_c0_g1_i1.p1  ORF type:complete len:270 (+),score=83.13 TRINITY_DN4887_c0_g1_i1:60-812(+)